MTEIIDSRSNDGVKFKRLQDCKAGDFVTVGDDVCLVTTATGILGGVFNFTTKRLECHVPTLSVVPVSANVYVDDYLPDDSEVLDAEAKQQQTDDR